jgi:hypothetical protein
MEHLPVSDGILTLPAPAEELPRRFRMFFEPRTWDLKHLNPSVKLLSNSHVVSRTPLYASWDCHPTRFQVTIEHGS